jgi:hypothetical protein
MKSILALSPNASEITRLIKADPMLSYLAEEQTAFETAMEERAELDNENDRSIVAAKEAQLSAQFKKLKHPILENLTVDSELTPQETFKSWRPALLRFAGIDSELPYATGKKKVEEQKMRLEIVHSIKEQPQGNPILAAYDKKGIKGVVDRYPDVFGDVVVAR